MYLRAVHAEPDIQALQDLIRDNPLGILTTAISSPNYPLLQSSHIPFVIDADGEPSSENLGRLRGHLARQNPHSKAIIEALQSATSKDNILEQEVMVLFTTPIHHYVTPKFYTETKPATGKVVPTWNYAAAQVYGKAKIFFDASSDETSGFLGKQTDDLTVQAETKIMNHTGEDGMPAPWKVSDAPDRYIDLLTKAIIGIEVTIDRLGGKFKMSQEMGDSDTDGIVQGFSNLESDVGRGMAELVEHRRNLKKIKQSNQ